MLAERLRQFHGTVDEHGLGRFGSQPVPVFLELPEANDSVNHLIPPVRSSGLIRDFAVGSCLGPLHDVIDLADESRKCNGLDHRVGHIAPLERNRI